MSRRAALLLALGSLLVAAPAASAADCPGADLQPTVANVVQTRAAVLCLANGERATAGLPALTGEARLEAAAQVYAQRMVAEQFFSHVAPDGGQLVARLAAYTGWTTIGENLAWGDGVLATPRSTVNAWMHSAGHRANLLSDAYQEIGIGVTPGAPQAAADGATTYATEFGGRATADPVATYQVAPPTAHAATVSATQASARAAAARRLATAHRKAAARRHTVAVRRCRAHARGAKARAARAASCAALALHRR